MTTSSSPALFSTFIMGLASAALIELGMVEDPSTNKKRLNKDAARQHIELLSVLQEKTRGNLTPEEKTLLEQALTDLRLQYVKITETTTSSEKK